MSLLTKPDGSAFDPHGLGMWFGDAIEAAGLPDACVMHGLRKTAARMLAEVGCPALEIMAVTGHKSLAEIERYTRAADQKRTDGRDPSAGTERKLNCEWQTLPPRSGKQVANPLI